MGWKFSKPAHVDWPFKIEVNTTSRKFPILHQVYWPHSSMVPVVGPCICVLCDRWTGSPAWRGCSLWLQESVQKTSTFESVEEIIQHSVWKHISNIELIPVNIYLLFLGLGLESFLWSRCASLISVRDRGMALDFHVHFSIVVIIFTWTALVSVLLCIKNTCLVSIEDSKIGFTCFSIYDLHASCSTHIASRWNPCHGAFLG